jgi:hypothetical protein
VAEQAAAAARKKRAGARTAGEHAARTAQHAPYDPGKDAALDAWLKTLAPSTPGMALPTVTPTPAFQWGDLSNLTPAPSGNAAAFTGGGGPNNIDAMALQAIRDAEDAATTTDHRFVDPFAELEAMDAFVPSGTGGLGLSPEVSDFLASLGGGGDGVITTGGDDGVVVTDGDGPSEVKTPEQLCAENGGTWINGACDMGGGTVLTPEQQCAENGGTWDGTSCVMSTATTDPYAEAKAQCALNNGMWNSATNTCTPIVQGAGAFDPNVTVDTQIEQQAGDQISIVEKALQQKNRSIQQALQAGLLSIGDAQQAWDAARAEIYQDFLTEQGLIQSGFATEQEEAASRRTTEREKLVTALNAAGVDSNLVADELAMIDEMYQGGATEQSEYLDAMGRIGAMSDADRRMMGQGVFGGYEQDLRSGIRDLQLGTNFQAADESKLARERGLQALGLSDFTGVDPETLYSALYAGVDVPGMAYGTSEREAGQEWAEGESALDRALAQAKFDESVRQFNWLGGRQDAATRTGISQWNKAFAREGEQYDATQAQYQDALDLEAERYATERQDIADALGLEADRWELGRETDPTSDFAGMTKAQQWEHHRLTDAALKSAGADAKPGSMMERVASVVMMEGWAPGELNKLVGEIDEYLADTYRGEDLSDENVLAALMSLERTDIIMSVLGTMGSEDLTDLIDALGVDAPARGSAQRGRPVVADGVDAAVDVAAGGGGPPGGGWPAPADDPFAYREPDGSWFTPSWPDSPGITIGGMKYTRRAWPDGLSDDQARRHIQRKLDEGFVWENTSETWKR